MEFFRNYFSKVSFDKEQTRVACPFHGDDNPSATINTEKSLFYCPVCGEGYNEVNFLSKVNNISLIEATKVINQLADTQTSSWGIIEKAELWGDAEFLNEVKELISEELIDNLNLGISEIDGKKFLGIPIYYNSVIMDVKRYNLLKHSGFPKMMGQKGGENGFIFPYDLWVKDKRVTYIVEGEKDAMVARDFGLNAITITGGASSEPNKFALSALKDKEIVVCYDNDDAGAKGAKLIYSKLYKIAKSVKYINISDIVKNEKEDFTDAVKKYGMDDFSFSLLEEHEFSEIDSPEINYTSLKDALSDNLIKKRIRTVVNVSAEYSDVFALPVVAEVEKVSMLEGNDKTNTIPMSSKFMWYFDKDRKIEQMLELIEVDAKKQMNNDKIKTFVGIPASEKGISVNVKNSESVYKYKIVDASSRADDEDGINNTVVDLYSFKKLEVGIEYDLDYLLLPHPVKNQKIMAVAREVEQLDIGRDFKINKDVLNTFKSEGTIKERVNKLYQSAKHHIAKHLNYNLWLMADLVMNSILEINYGQKTWGALDVFILGDTSTGKSEATKGLVNLYDFGHFLSLKTATAVGLIGGSKKEGDSLVNTIGAIPRQHKKLVVMEEFSGADPSFIKTMTDIRTTRRVHIIRISGELSVACNLRMITISNPLGDEKGLPKYLSTFPNGVLPLMELINNPEDVGRYDGFILMPQVTTRFNPFNHKLEGEPIDKSNYQYKSKWVYTRTSDDVVFADGVDAYIWDKAEELNNKYESNFPLFGTKAPLKLARFSVALASLIVNTDESYEKIIVTKEIVDFIMDYFDSIYSDKLFKLNDYKLEYDSYNSVNKEDIKELQELYPKNSNIINYLEGTSMTSLENLRANSGLDQKDFNVLYTKLSQLKFVRSLGRSIVPTTKFRMAITKIDKSFTTGAGLSAKKVNKTFIVEENDEDELW